MMSPEDCWKRIVEIYNHAKALHMLAEEIDPDHETFVAPLIQHRDTLDHILRTRAIELGMQEATDEDHADRNLDKALGHAYRAFFDIADWLGLLLREQALVPLEGLSRECIQAIMPEYYPKWRRTLDDGAKKLVEIRSAKDVGNATSLIKEVDQYVELLNTMHEIVKEIRAREGAAADWNTRRRAEDEKLAREDAQKNTTQNWINWKIALIGGGICTLLGAVAAKIIG